MGCSFFVASDGCRKGFSSSEKNFLDSCNLCKKLLGSKDDIFMYRGDTPFCSEDCRLVQIEIDEAMERKKKSHLSSSSTKKRVASSTMKKEQKHVRAAPTVIAS